MGFKKNSNKLIRILFSKILFKILKKKKFKKDCWVPAQFKASYEKYADSYCWIAGSWYTPMDKELPLSERERRQHRIRYYQWVPFLLLFQAILFYIPRIIWRTLNVRSGLDIVNLVDAAIKYESVDKFSDREKIMEYLIRNIERYIGARRSRYERLYGRQLCTTHKSPHESKQHQLKNTSKMRQPSSIGLCCTRCWLRIKIVLSTICFWTGKRLGNYLVVLYMFVKTLWLTNAVSQLFLLNRFIGNDYHAFGIEIIEMLLSGQEWHELRHFPRVTYCDFKIREIGNSHDWTVQCVLRINLFNEVIYIFMWFWLCILAVCSLIDYATWTLRILIPSDKLRFVKRHLDIYNYYLPSNQKAKLNKSQQHETSINTAGQEAEYSNNFEYVDIEKEKKLMKEFTFSYLKDDGVFAMRILASSASDLIVTEVISELWKNFKNNYVEPADEVTLISSPSSSSSSSSSSSHQTSAASSPSSLLSSNQLTNANKNSPSSPTNLIKKPFNYTLQQQQQQQQQSPIYSNTIKASPQHANPNTTIINLNQTPMPPPPLTAMPQINQEEQSLSKKSGNGAGLYPHLQQRHLHHHTSSIEHSSSANPNAKDTHV